MSKSLITSKRITNRTESDEILKSFYTHMASQTNGYVRIRSSNPRKRNNPTEASTVYHNFSLDNFKADRFDDLFSLKGFSGNNMFIGYSAYRTPKKATKNDLVSSIAFCVDVDYTGKYQKAAPEDVLETIFDGLFMRQQRGFSYAFPTLVEFSHRLRLIYVLKTPFIFMGKGRTRALAKYDAIERSLVDMINAIDKDMNAEVQSPTKFMRAPGSINKKYPHAYIEYRFVKTKTGKKIRKPFFVSGTPDVHTVRIIKALTDKDPDGYREYWDIDELAYRVVPGWKTEYSPRPLTERKMSNKTSSYTPTLTDYCDDRLSLLRALQEEGADKGSREKLNYLYWNTCLAKGMSFEEAEKETWLFNKGFTTPMRKNEFKNCAPAGKRHTKMKNETFCEFLGIPTSRLPKRCNKALNARLQQIRTGTTKAQKIHELSQNAKEMLNAGLSKKEIAEILNVSLKTVYNYLNDTNHQNVSAEDLEKDARTKYMRPSKPSSDDTTAVSSTKIVDSEDFGVINPIFREYITTTDICEDMTVADAMSDMLTWYELGVINKDEYIKGIIHLHNEYYGPIFYGFVPPNRP